MTNFEKLMAVGAQCVGGDLIYKHKVLGSFRNGDFRITKEGTALLAQDIEDVEVKTEAVKPKATRKKAPEPVAATSPVDELLAGIDDLE